MPPAGTVIPLTMKPLTAEHFNTQSQTQTQYLSDHTSTSALFISLQLAQRAQKERNQQYIMTHYQPISNLCDATCICWLDNNSAYYTLKRVVKKDAPPPRTLAEIIGKFRFILYTCYIYILYVFVVQ